MTVVDYGCGPGRYTFRFANLVGREGKVYAVDVQPLAVAAIRSRAEREKIGNVHAVQATGYKTGVPNHAADMVFAIDMFSFVREVEPFLRELKRIAKRNAVLVIDDGHNRGAQQKPSWPRAGTV